MQSGWMMPLASRDPALPSNRELREPLVRWKNSVRIKTKGQSTGPGSGLRALCIREKKDKSDPEGKASQTNVPHIDHGQ